MFVFFFFFNRIFGSFQTSIIHFLYCEFGIALFHRCSISYILTKLAFFIRASSYNTKTTTTKSFLNAVLSGTVAVITSDGRMIVGTLKGFDQTINLILDESHERVFSSSQGVEQVVLGLYIVRGDNVAVIGEIDEETDSALDLGNIRAEPLNSVAH
uniref:U6 snRNA-associated Sm-like protein LSm8 n=1 Tax=Sarcophilus harrisii TaxID=9305 RepID=A0A7N4V2V1_SARHA